MNSYKRYIRDKHLDTISDHPIDVALRKARVKAEKEIFKQKVQAHLIMAGAMVIILIMSFYW